MAEINNLLGTLDGGNGCPVSITGTEGQVPTVDENGCIVFEDPTGGGNTSTFADNGDGSVTHNDGAGTIVSTNVSKLVCDTAEGVYDANLPIKAFQGAACTPVVIPANTAGNSTTVDNGDGTATVTTDDAVAATYVTDNDTYADPATGNPNAPGGPSSITLQQPDGTTQVVCEGADDLVFTPALNCSPRGLLTNLERDGKDWIATQVSDHDTRGFNAVATGNNVTGAVAAGTVITPVASATLNNLNSDRTMRGFYMITIDHADLVKLADDGDFVEFGVEIEVSIDGAPFAPFAASSHIYLRSLETHSADFSKAVTFDLGVPPCSSRTVDARLVVFGTMTANKQISGPAVRVMLFGSTQVN